MKNSFHQVGSRRDLLLAAFFALAVFSTAIRAQSPPSTIEDVYRAEQSFENGRLRQAAESLQVIVESASGNRQSEATTRAAMRLLTLVYHQSGDERQTLVVGERYEKLGAEKGDKNSEIVPLESARFAAAMAEAYLAVGRRDDASRELEVLRALLPKKSSSGLTQTKLAVVAARIDADLQATAAADEANTALAQTGSVIIDPTQYSVEQRCQAVLLQTDQFLSSNDPARAVTTLSEELCLPVYTAVELSEFKMKLADSYRQLAAQRSEKGDKEGSHASIVRQQTVLDDLLNDLSYRLTELTQAGSKDVVALTAADRAAALIPVYDRLGAVLESKAELALNEISREEVGQGGESSPQQREALEAAIVDHLMQASDAYTQLYQQSVELTRYSNSAFDSGSAQHEDAALCGLQRVYEALRKSVAADAERRVRQPLLKVSKKLVAIRTERLLPSDPALQEARGRLACVYGSLNEHKLAEPIYRDLVGYWGARSEQNPQQFARTLLGLSESLRALNQIDEAVGCAQQAAQVLTKMSQADRVAQPELNLLAAQIDNSLGVLSIAQGDYQTALAHLTAANHTLDPANSATADLRRQNEKALNILSRVRVYRGLLHKAEAQYANAAAFVREGRELRQQSGKSMDLLAYYLAEASVHLAWAKSQNASERMAELDQAASLLDEALPLVDSGRDTDYRYLHSVLLRMKGQNAAARDELTELVRSSETRGDRKMAAKCYIELAQITASADAAELRRNMTDLPSREELAAMKAEKLQIRDRLAEAADYAGRAVKYFQNPEGDSNDLQATTPYPSLHFQASYFAARLHVYLDDLQSQIEHLDKLLITNVMQASFTTALAGTSSTAPAAASHRSQAIDYLTNAIDQAERPTSTTNQQRADRARFFTRYAPAYNLLVDLCVAEAVGDSRETTASQPSAAYDWLRRAVQVADQARNRTFREQINNWQKLAGAQQEQPKFEWDRHIKQLATPDTAILVYHLGDQESRDGSAFASNGQSTVGGGHLFVILDQGRTIRYFRLQDYLNEEGDGVRALTRKATGQYVACHLNWMAEGNSNRDWGRRSQQRLSASVFPLPLLDMFTDANVRSSHPKRLIIVPDGPLHQLPFESLMVPNRNGETLETVQYLLDVLPPISYGPSLSVMAAIDERSHGASARPVPAFSLLTAGRPEYPPKRDQKQMPAWQQLLRQVHADEFTALTNSGRECDAVNASYSDLPDSKRIELLGADATEANVRKHIQASRIIHFAVHGCVDHQDDNLYGGLVFTPGVPVSNGDDNQDNDGLLQLRDIYSLDLGNCDLAILSACQTYVGANRELEAGMSMARAFLEQGARQVVCSDWSISDEATSDLIAAFFQEVQAARQNGETTDYAEALYHAKQKMRSHPRWGSEPRYWAALVIVGNGTGG